MADYPRMQTAMNETRDNCSAVAAQLDAIGTGGGGSSGNNNGGGDSDFLVQKKDLRVDNYHGDEINFVDFVEETKTYADCMMPVVGDVLEWIEMQDRIIPEGSLIAKLSHSLNRVNRVIAGFLSQAQGQGRDLAQVPGERRGHANVEDDATHIRPAHREHQA